MSCIDCTNCKTALPAIPDCFAGEIIIGTGAIATVYVINIKKGNGSAREAEYASDGAGLITVDLVDYSVSGLSWFTPGKYEMQIMDANRNAADIQDAATTEANCLIFEVVRVSQANDNDITWTYS